MTLLTPEQLAEITARDALYVTPDDWRANADYFHFVANVHEDDGIGPRSGWSGAAQVLRDRRALLSHVSALTTEIARLTAERDELVDELRKLRMEVISAVGQTQEALEKLSERDAYISQLEESVSGLTADLEDERTDAAIDSAMSPKVLPEREG